MIVIPRLDRGIQSFQVMISPLDTGSCRRTGETTFYETIISILLKTKISPIYTASEQSLYPWPSVFKLS